MRRIFQQLGSPLITLHGITVGGIVACVALAVVMAGAIATTQPADPLAGKTITLTIDGVDYRYRLVPADADARDPAALPPSTAPSAGSDPIAGHEPSQPPTRDPVGATQPAIDSVVRVAEGDGLLAAVERGVARIALQPGGEYRISRPIRLRDQRIDGAGATIRLTAKAGHAIDLAGNAVIADLQIHAPSDVPGVTITGDGNAMLRITHLAGYALLRENGSAGRLYMEDCRIAGEHSYGVLLAGGKSERIEIVRLTNVVNGVRHNRGPGGSRVEGGIRAHNVASLVIRDCHLDYRGGTGAALRLMDGTGITVSGGVYRGTGTGLGPLAKGDGGQLLPASPERAAKLAQRLSGVRITGVELSAPLSVNAGLLDAEISASTIHVDQLRLIDASSAHGYPDRDRLLPGDIRRPPAELRIIDSKIIDPARILGADQQRAAWLRLIASGDVPASIVITGSTYNAWRLLP